MKKKICCFAVFWSLVWIFGGALFFMASAETGYVSDMLILTLREGPGRGYPVLSTLRSNMPVEILETGETFYKVRDENGIEGWVERQYITFDIPLTMVITKLEKKVEALEDQNKRMAQERTPIQQSMEAMNKKNSAVITELKLSLQKEVQEKKRLSAEVASVQKAYEQLKKDAKNTIGLIDENKVLKKKLAGIQSDIDTLKIDNKTALKTAMIKWFLGGAGVLFLGWIIGRSFSGRKKNSGSLLN